MVYKTLAHCSASVSVMNGPASKFSSAQHEQPVLALTNQIAILGTIPNSFQQQK
jgi:hypothetical protein